MRLFRRALFGVMGLLVLAYRPLLLAMDGMPAVPATTQVMTANMVLVDRVKSMCNTSSHHISIGQRAGSQELLIRVLSVDVPGQAVYLKATPVVMDTFICDYDITLVDATSRECLPQLINPQALASFGDSGIIQFGSGYARQRTTEFREMSDWLAPRGVAQQAPLANSIMLEFGVDGHGQPCSFVKDKKNGVAIGCVPGHISNAQANKIADEYYKKRMEMRPGLVVQETVIGRLKDNQKHWQRVSDIHNRDCKVDPRWCADHKWLSKQVSSARTALSQAKQSHQPARRAAAPRKQAARAVQTSHVQLERVRGTLERSKQLVMTMEKREAGVGGPGTMAAREARAQRVLARQVRSFKDRFTFEVKVLRQKTFTPAYEQELLAVRKDLIAQKEAGTLSEIDQTRLTALNKTVIQQGQVHAVSRPLASQESALLERLEIDASTCERFAGNELQKTVFDQNRSTISQLADIDVVAAPEAEPYVDAATHMAVASIATVHECTPEQSFALSDLSQGLCDIAKGVARGTVKGVVNVGIGNFIVAVLNPFTRAKRMAELVGRVLFTFKNMQGLSNIQGEVQAFLALPLDQQAERVTEFLVTFLGGGNIRELRGGLRALGRLIRREVQNLRHAPTYKPVTIGGARLVPVRPKLSGNPDMIPRELAHFARVQKAKVAPVATGVERAAKRYQRKMLPAVIHEPVMPQLGKLTAAQVAQGMQVGKSVTRGAASRAVSRKLTLDGSRELFRKLAGARGKNSIWAKIEPTQGSWNPHSMIPKSFIMDVDGRKLWIAPNATEHLMEFVSPKSRLRDIINPLQPIWTKPAKEYAFSHELVLERMHGILKAVVERCGDRLSAQQEVKMIINRWEVSIGPSRIDGGLPTVYHFNRP